MHGSVKLHLFYLTDKYITTKDYPVANMKEKTYDDYTDSEYVLYAYTLDKDMAKVFSSWRDPRKFMHKVMKVSEDEYNRLSNEWPQQKLIDYALVKKDIKDDSFVGTHMYLTMTSAEARYILEYRYELLIEQLKIGIHDDIDIYAFLGSLLDDEDEFIFREIFPLSLIHERDYPLDEYSIEDIEVDELSLFLTYFGNTFSSGGAVSCFGSSIECRQQRSLIT